MISKTAPIAGLQIVFITNNYRPYSGGVVSSIDAAAQGLRAQGHEVTIITLDFEGEAGRIEQSGIIRLFCPIRFFYKNNPMAIPWRMRHHLQGCLTSLKPDIVHVHHPFFLAVVGMEIAKEMKIPVVFTYHTRYDLYAHYIPLPRQLTQPLIMALVKNFCAQTTGIIAPTPSLKDFLTQQNIAQPIHVIPSSIPDHFFEPCEKQATRLCKIICVARWTPEKDIPFLLEVMNLLIDEPVHLALIGYGCQKEELMAQAAALNLHNVSFVEKPGKELLLESYRQSQIFVFASTTETQGLVLAEAMATGNAVIARHAPGSSDIIEEGFNGYLVDSKEEMAERIKALMRDKQLLKTIQSNAGLTAERYRQRVMAESLLNCYGTIIDRNSL